MRLDFANRGAVEFFYAPSLKQSIFTFPGILLTGYRLGIQFAKVE